MYMYVYVCVLVMCGYACMHIPLALGQVIPLCLDESAPERQSHRRDSNARTRRKRDHQPHHVVRHTRVLRKHVYVVDAHLAHRLHQALTVLILLLLPTLYVHAYVLPARGNHALRERVHGRILVVPRFLARDRIQRVRRAYAQLHVGLVEQRVQVYARFGGGHVLDRCYVGKRFEAGSQSVEDEVAHARVIAILDRLCMCVYL
jgi:hypothetical protein